MTYDLQLQIDDNSTEINVNKGSRGLLSKQIESFTNGHLIAKPSSSSSSSTKQIRHSRNLSNTAKPMKNVCKLKFTQINTNTKKTLNNVACVVFGRMEGGGGILNK
jgi:hypothetical protein